MGIKRFVKFIFINIFKIPEEKLSLSKGRITLLCRRLLGSKSIVITNRESLPVLLNFMRLTDKGAEVGVAEGNFSELILKYSKLSTLYSIDPWKEFGNDAYDDVNNVPQEEQDRRYEFTKNRLEKYGDRSKLLRMTSCDAAALFDPQSFNFIYLDANHSYKECKIDLETWGPKLRVGGIFAGHDYVNGVFSQGTFEVKKAVDEFVEKYDQKLFRTYEPWPAWYLVKEEVK